MSSAKLRCRDRIADVGPVGLIETCRLQLPSTGPVRAEFVKLELNGYGYGYPLPLGRRLSPISRRLISLHNGYAKTTTRHTS